MSDTLTVFTLDGLKSRLASFGYTVKDTDTDALNFVLEKVRSTIKNEINWQDVPVGLEHIAVDRAVGEFLMMKKTFAPDDLSMIDLSAAVQQISTGDTTTSFAWGSGSSTAEQRMDSFIQYLLTYGNDEFSAFRRIRWG